MCLCLTWYLFTRGGGLVQVGVAGASPTSGESNIRPMGVSWKEWTQKPNCNPNIFVKAPSPLFTSPQTTPVKTITPSRVMSPEWARGRMPGSIPGGSWINYHDLRAVRPAQFHSAMATGELEGRSPWTRGTVSPSTAAR